MAKYINADDCYKYFYEHLNDEAMPGAMNAVEEMPESIVRCKDCKFNYGIANNCEFSKSDIVCTLWESDGFDESDFCSHGERRKNE